MEKYNTRTLLSHKMAVYQTKKAQSIPKKIKQQSLKKRLRSNL